MIPIADFALGGTERIAIRLANAWARAGRDVTLFCGRDDGVLARLIDRATVRVVVAPGGIARGAGSRRRLGKAAAAWLAAAPVDLCFIPGNYHWQAIPPLASMPLSIRPRIVAQVSAAVVKPQRHGLRRWIYERRLRALLGGTDAAVTLAETAARDIRRIVPATPVTTIPLPALEDDLPPPAPATGRTIVAAGRLVKEKGFADLIEAFASMGDRLATLIILGSGPEKATLSAQVERLHLQHRVRLAGYTDDIRPYLDSARLFVLSSHYEGYAAVVVEALAAGRPVVATDCTPATGELLEDERFGIVVPILDPPAMAAALDRMLAMPPPDPDLLAAKVARHRLIPVAHAYLDLFGRIGGGR